MGMFGCARCEKYVGLWTVWTVDNIEYWVRVGWSQCVPKCTRGQQVSKHALTPGDDQLVTEIRTVITPDGGIQ